jgi:acyl carrier protein
LADDQVKIRGFRIEPGEIQKQLEQIEGVKTAVVLAVGQTSADRFLAAFVQRKPGSTQADEAFRTDLWEEELQRAIRACVPEYMVPAITVVDEVPLTPNGKVDKKALLEMAASRVLQRESAVEMTGTESRLAALWAKLLGIDCVKIGPATSLFDFGGHSLLLVKLANEIGAELEVKIPLRILFEARNLRDVARAIDVETILQLVEQKSNSAVIVEEGYL